MWWSQPAEEREANTCSRQREQCVQVPRGGKEPGTLEGLRDAKCDWDLRAAGVAGDEMVELDRGWDTESHVGHCLEWNLYFECSV